MNKRLLIAAMLAMGLTGFGCAANHAGHECKEMKEKEKKTEKAETKITADQVPAAVKATMEKEAGGAPLSEFEKETDEGKTVYEADATSGGQTYEIAVAEDGTLLKKKLEKPEAAEKDEAREKADEKK